MWQSMVYEYKRPILLSLRCGMTDTRARMLLDHPKEQRIIEMGRCYQRCELPQLR